MDMLELPAIETCDIHKIGRKSVRRPQAALGDVFGCERVARRVHWVPPSDVVKLVHRAAGEPDKEKQIALWVQYQKIMVDQANLFMLFQPIYQIGERRSIKAFPLTTAGWQHDM